MNIKNISKRQGIDLSYLPLTEDDRREMLATIGVKDFEGLVSNVPASLRVRSLGLEPALSEFELKCYIESALKENKTAQELNSFLGAGSYDHYIPSSVRHILSRGEFYSAYTPYQAEASQGTLQALFEYQSMIVELTGLDVANGSHYDGATAFAESVLLALNHTRRSKALISRSIHPEYRRVVKTYFSGTEYEVEEISFGADAKLDRAALEEKLSEKVGCVAVANPNFFGIVEDLSGLAEKIHEQGALFLVTGHPLSFSVFRSPGEWGADIACGEAQPLGVPLSFGGPYVGYLATSRALMSRVPGRLVGLTRDRNGKRAFVLTLQAREQHIRREKANSNICTNQALCALAVCVYLATMGEKGLHDAALSCVEKANKLQTAISGLKNFEIPFSGTIFNEFTVRSKKALGPTLQGLLDKGVVAGYPLEKDYPELKDHFLVAVTEKKSEDNLKELVSLLEKE